MHFQKLIGKTIIGLFIILFTFSSTNIVVEASNNVVIEVENNSLNNFDNVYKQLGDNTISTKSNTSISIENNGWANISTNYRKEYVCMDPSNKDLNPNYIKHEEYETDENTMFLLAAIIHCEARGENYEGQLAVGSVVMNRVRSSKFPDTIEDVIYAKGQFSPVISGKVDEVYESGKINESCIEAAKEVLSGVSNVGDLTYFRKDDGREGLVIGNHVFY